MYGVVEDLRRNCQHSDYMFLFSRELIRSVENKLDENPAEVMNDGNLQKRKAKSIWCSKTKRLRQELEHAVLLSSDSDSQKGLETQQALDKSSAFALRFTDLYNTAFHKSPALLDFVREIIDVIKNKTVETSHIQRIYSILTG
jgi:hypothetical protein